MKFNILALLFCCLVGFVASPANSVAAPNAVYQQTEERPISQDIAEPFTLELEVISAGKETEKVIAGDLVVISVKGSAATSYKWSILPETDNFLVIENGTRAVFSSRGNEGTQEYTVIVSGANENGQVDHVYQILTIKGNLVSVEPSLKQDVIALCEDVESPTKRDDVLKLAQAFATVASAMPDNAGVKEFTAKTKEASQNALNGNYENWFSFREGLAILLFEEKNQGRLLSTADHKRAWETIAQALTEYANELN